MQIRRGSNRIAVIVGGLVFKFPRLSGINPHARWYFWQGIWANLSEYFLSLLWRDKVSFLVPVYFTIGIMSVQKYQTGEAPKPGDEQYESVWHKLPKGAKGHMAMMDPHQMDYKNWRKTPSGLRLIDYGDKFGEQVPLSGFIARWSRELERLLTWEDK